MSKICLSIPTRALVQQGQRRSPPDSRQPRAKPRAMYKPTRKHLNILPIQRVLQAVANSLGLIGNSIRGHSNQIEAMLQQSLSIASEASDVAASGMRGNNFLRQGLQDPIGGI